MIRACTSLGEKKASQTHPPLPLGEAGRRPGEGAVRGSTERQQLPVRDSECRSPGLRTGLFEIRNTPRKKQRYAPRGHTFIPPPCQQHLLSPSLLRALRAFVVPPLTLNSR